MLVLLTVIRGKHLHKKKTKHKLMRLAHCIPVWNNTAKWRIQGCRGNYFFSKDVPEWSVKAEVSHKHTPSLLCRCSYSFTVGGLCPLVPIAGGNPDWYLECSFELGKCVLSDLICTLVDKSHFIFRRQNSSNHVVSYAAITQPEDTFSTLISENSYIIHCINDILLPNCLS